MSIAYSGAHVSQNFLLTIGTLADLVDELHTRLTGVGGWTAVSGASGDWIIESGTTPEGLQCRCRLFVPGGAVSAQVQFRNLDASKLGATHYLEANLTYTYWLFACPYQFFFLAAGKATTPGTFVAGGVPKLEAPFLSPADYGLGRYDVIWSQGNTNTDDRALLKNSFRNAGHARDTGQAWNLVNNDSWTSTIGAGGITEGQGCQRLITIAPAFTIPYFGPDAGAGYGRVLWDDGTTEGKPMVVPARICWHPVDYQGFAPVQGLLWDAVVGTADFPDLQALTNFDGLKDWMNICDLVFPYSNQSLCGLFLLTT